MRDGSALLIPIELDRPRRLRFDFNAFAAYEEATGKNVLAGDLQADLSSVRGLRALLWAALLHEDPELTQQQVGAMLHLGNLTEMTGRVQAALAQALPDPEPEGNAPAAAPSARSAPARRDGRTSGR